MISRAIVAAACGLVLAGSSEARAGACGGYATISAAGPTLAPNGLVLFETSWDPAEIEKALPNAKLVGANISVGVKVVQTLEGGRLQVLIAPAQSLPANTSIHLSIGIPDLDEWLAHSELMTAATEDDSPPTWRKAPSVRKRQIEPSHKDDSIDVYTVTVPIEGPAFVLATITGSKTTERVLSPVAGRTIEVGITGCHSMWSPWVSPYNKGPFRVELTAIAASGRETAAPGRPLRLRF